MPRRIPASAITATKRNMGAGWNIRRVYELATGKYFKQAAHDGMVQPDFLSLCLDALEADESLVLAHSLIRVIDEDGQLLENYDDRYAPAHWPRWCAHETCCSKATDAIRSSV